MLDKAKEYMRRRRAARTAKKLAAAMSKGKTALGGQAIGNDHAPIATGHVTIQVRPVGGDGKADCSCDALGVGCSHWDNIHSDDNLVVTQAEGLMAQMAIGAASSALSYIELGDPSPATAPALTNTGLEQTTAERKAVTPTAVGNVVTCTATWGSAEGNGFTYTESGLFTGILGSGTMFARKTFAGITKTSSFELRFTWLITFLVNTQGGDCTGISLLGPSSVSAFTVYNSGDVIAAGGEASVSATFDFAVGANNLDVFLNGQRLIPGVQYVEADIGALTAPIGGSALQKGVNFVGFTLNLTPTPDQVFLIQRTLA